MNRINLFILLSLLFSLFCFGCSSLVTSSTENEEDSVVYSEETETAIENVPHEEALLSPEKTISEGSFSWETIDGYTYDIEFTIVSSFSVDNSLGNPGEVGLILDLAGSSIKVKNTTPNKPAGNIFIHIFPYYELGSIGPITTNENYGQYENLVIYSSPVMESDQENAAVAGVYSIGLNNGYKTIGFCNDVSNLQGSYNYDREIPSGETVDLLVAYTIDGSDFNASSKHTFIVKEEYAESLICNTGWIVTPSLGRQDEYRTTGPGLRWAAKTPPTREEGDIKGARLINVFYNPMH